jgi:hypothetical protein
MSRRDPPNGTSFDETFSGPKITPIKFPKTVWYANQRLYTEGPRENFVPRLKTFPTVPHSVFRSYLRKKFRYLPSLAFIFQSKQSKKSDSFLLKLQSEVKKKKLQSKAEANEIFLYCFALTITEKIKEKIKRKNKKKRKNKTPLFSKTKNILF